MNDISITEFLEKRFQVVSLYKNPEDHSTDNALLFTSTFFALSHVLGTDNFIIDRLRNAFITFIKCCQVEKNVFLYNRFPDCPGNNAHDDLIGICTFFKLNGISASPLLNEFEVRRWFLDVENYKEPYSISWWLNSKKLRWQLNRHNGLKAYVKFCANESLDFMDLLRFSTGVLAPTLLDKSNTSAKLLSLLMVIGTKSSTSKSINWTRRLFLDKLKKQYSSVDELMEIYYGKAHPFANSGLNFDDLY